MIVVDKDDPLMIGVFKGLDMAAWQIIKEMIDIDPEWAEKSIKNTLSSLLLKKSAKD